MKLHLLSWDDLPMVATIHRAAFPRAAISRLGQAAACRYYESLMSGPYGTVGLGIFAEEQLAGYCFVGIRHIAETAYVRRHIWFLAWRLLTHPGLLTEPFIRDRIVSGLRLLVPAPRSPVCAAPTGPETGRSYGIQYIAVDPLCQGRGVGKKLVSASEDYARQQGCTEIHLSVYLDNVRAIRLYERMGWSRLCPPGERWQGFMSKRLDQPAATEASPVAASPTAISS